MPVVNAPKTIWKPMAILRDQLVIFAATTQRRLLGIPTSQEKRNPTHLDAPTF